MIGLIIKNNNYDIENLIFGIQKYYYTKIPLMENWTPEQHNKFELILRESKDILFENKNAKYQYISNFFENKDEKQCLLYFEYCKNIILDLKNNNNIVWLDHSHYLNNKNITNIFKKFFFIEIIDSFKSINSDNTIYIINNIEKILFDNHLIDDIYNKKVLITNNKFNWWLDINKFIQIYNQKYHKGSEMKKILLNGYIKNNNLSIEFISGSQRCFRILIIEQILKIYNACKMKKYKKIKKMLEKINIEFNISEDIKNKPLKTLFDSIMQKWLPFPKSKDLLNIISIADEK